MKIAVLIKQVPDTFYERRLDPDTGAVDRSSGGEVFDEINERALEAALRLKEAAGKRAGGEVTVLTMGPAGAADTLRKALAMGADRAIHVLDDALAGSDAVQTSAVLARALGSAAFDLVIAGNESTDGRAGAVPAMLAERLGLPQLTFLRTLAVEDGVVSGERMTEEGYVEACAVLPAVVSVTEQIGEARYPSFLGLRAAKKKPLQTLTLAELGLPAGQAGGAHAASRVRTVTARPARAAGTIVSDDGTAGRQIADFLAAARLI